MALDTDTRTAISTQLAGFKPQIAALQRATYRAEDAFRLAPRADSDAKAAARAAFRAQRSELRHKQEEAAAAVRAIVEQYGEENRDEIVTLASRVGALPAQAAR